jgi:hypothetical protein
VTSVRAIAARLERPDAASELRGIGVIAAALVLAFGIGFVVRGGGGESRAAVAHSCAATDKRFIQTATTNMTALGVWADGFRSGDIEADEVAEQARDAARRVRYVKPRDPSLRLAQRLIDGMFNEYGQAVALAAKERARAGKHMHRAYGLANFARDVLTEAQPQLAKHGCDVGPLL